jgi:hypothetical protein
MQEKRAKKNKSARQDVANAGGGDEDGGPSRIVADELPAAERLLVLALLRTDRAERWSRAELVRELSGVPAGEVESALLNLATRGIACVEAEHARAAPPTWGLDGLGVICV